jgi:hypothetical protein
LQYPADSLKWFSVAIKMTLPKWIENFLNASSSFTSEDDKVNFSSKSNISRKEFDDLVNKKKQWMKDNGIDKC